MHRTIALSIILVSMATIAKAQPPASSFAELAKLLKAGDTVFVTNNAGETSKGRVQHVSGSSLVLRSGGRDLSVAAPDVRRIARSRHALRNGALIGLAAGGVAGAAWAASQPCEIVCFSSRGGVLAFGGLFGAIGLGVGAATGAMLPGQHVLFDRTAAGGASAAAFVLPGGGSRFLVQLTW